MFFKGYVETKDKKCIEKFKNRTDFKTFEQVQSLPEFAGILATDTILVDIDDSESSELLFKVVKEYSLCCRVYKTSRGKHFLFKNSGVPTNKTGCKLAIGVTADIKIGTRSSYEVLKYGGKMREILYDTAENEEAQPLPRWLHPVKSNMEFLNMDAGDGRNQSLFNYILTLQSNDFTDLIYRGFGDDEPLDFLKDTLEDFEGDIITNPPYKYALEFVQRALDSVQPGRKVAMFLKLQFLEGKNRKEFFLKNPPKTVYVSSSRLICAMNGEFSKYPYIAISAGAVFLMLVFLPDLFDDEEPKQKKKQGKLKKSRNS